MNKRLKTIYLRKTRATSMGPWLTVVPMQPCSSICRIFGSFAYTINGVNLYELPGI
jgi:hypothetical protein